jgi:hypothetical protein
MFVTVPQSLSSGLRLINIFHRQECRMQGSTCIQQVASFAKPRKQARAVRYNSSILLLGSLGAGHASGLLVSLGTASLFFLGETLFISP